MTSVEGITEYQLANGLRLLVFPDQSKSTITVNITYLVGSRQEDWLDFRSMRLPVGTESRKNRNPG